MNPDLWKKLLKLILGILVFTVFLNLSIGWAVTEKPWYEQFWVTIASAGGLGAAGTVLGLVIGGIGLAIGGGAIGLAGWLVFGVLGFSVGALGGSLYTIFADPGKFDFNYFKLVILFIGIGVSVFIAFLYASKVGRMIFGYLKKLFSNGESTP